ncbi:MAG: LysR family transcriptional regulator [bacterium]|nr:LysR family transcriptional regulator [bacterium]
MSKTLSRPKHKPVKRLSGNPVKLENYSDITLKARIWIDAGGETYLAPGRVTLLERIAEYGSITGAAKSMEMSYRHAWLLVDDMNGKAPKPLVVRASGGKGGGGTHLTDEGKRAIKTFNELQRKLGKFIKTLSA